MLYQQILHGGFFMNKTAKRGHPQKRTVHPHTHKATDEHSPIHILQGLAKSLLITASIGIALTISASLIAYFYTDPDLLIRPLALVASTLTALIGGFFAAKLNRESAILCGFLNGGAFTCLMILASLFFKAYASGYAALISALLHAAFMLLSLLGAYLGQKKAQKKRRRR